MQTRHTVQNTKIPKNPKIQVLKKKSSYTGDLFGALDFLDVLEFLDVLDFLFSGFFGFLICTFGI